MDKAIEMNKNNPEFRYYINMYSDLSKDELLLEMRQVHDPIAKSALGYLVKRK